MKKRIFKLIVSILIILLLASLVLYLSWGSYKISPLDIMKTLLGEGTKLQKAAVLNIRVARLLVGPYHKNFLIISAIISTIIILVADSVSRNLFSPIEIPVGITISILGVPYFIYLMMKEK